MAYLVRITVMSLLMVCSSGLVKVLDNKINAIRVAMESEIALLRHDMGNFSSQLEHLLHHTGFSSKVQNVSQCGCEKAETGQTGDQFIFNQVIRKGFEYEKKSLKNYVERIHSYVNSIMKDVDRINRSMTSYQVDISESKSHVKRIDDITVIQSREILAMKQQMSSFMTKLDSLNKTFERRLEGVERDVSATRGFEARINTSEAALNKRPEYSFKTLGSVHKHGKSIYVRPNGATDYYSATKVCTSIGGYLVEISSEEENAFIKRTFVTTSFTLILLGGTDGITEGNWKWAHSGDRIPLRNQRGFQNWAAYEPNNRDSKEHCMIMNSDGTWDADLCGYNFEYVCESDLF